MKVLKFANHLIPSLLAGEKTSTWRLFDDKSLSPWDDLEFRNSENNEIVGYGTIISLNEKQIKNINKEDYEGHEKFKNREEIVTHFKKYYGESVNEDSMVKIIYFSFKKA